MIDGRRPGKWQGTPANQRNKPDTQQTGRQPINGQAWDSQHLWHPTDWLVPIENVRSTALPTGVALFQ